MKLTGIVLVLILISVACAPLLGLEEQEFEPRVESTFGRFYQLAKAGDAESQNLIGFMLFFGEVAPYGRPLAHRWFLTAAGQGNVSAQLNLAVMHYLGAGTHEDHAEAERYFRMAQETNSEAGPASTLEFSTLIELVDQSCRRTEGREAIGERTFGRFCSGCHGMNGIAAYGGSPSFALGERMEKSDNELFMTIMHGHDVMPVWGGKLPKERLSQALRFIRFLQREFRNGLLHVIRSRNTYYFTFGPMASNSNTYGDDDILEWEDRIESFIRLCGRAGH